MAWTSPRTWVAGEIPTAATFNTHVRDNFKAIGDAWTAYTPTLSNWTLSNGTLTGAYLQAGKLVIFRILYTVGSTDTKSGGPVFSLPAATDSARAGMCIGEAFLNDVSAPTRAYRRVIQNSSTGCFMASDDDTRLSPTAPWTWATGDLMTIQGLYEAS